MEGRDPQADNHDPRTDADAWACPTCRRALAPGEDECPRCHEPRVLSMSLSGASLPAVPPHLQDAVDHDQTAEHADEHAFEEPPDEPPDAHGLPEPPPVGGPLWLGGAGPDGGGLDGGSC